MNYNLHKQDILCPDCGINYIDEDRYKNYKKCISCARRETLASTKNLPYIRYIDLPQEEKDRLAKQRAQNNAWAKKRNEKETDDTKKEDIINEKPAKIPMEEKRTNERIVKEFLDYKNYLNVSYVSIKTTELYSQFISFCNIKKYGVMSRINFYSLLLDNFGFSRKMSNGCNYIFRGDRLSASTIDIPKPKIKPVVPKVTASVSKPKVRANQVYTEDIIAAVMELSSTDKTVTELRNEIVELFPDAKITVANFNNIINRKQVPHKPFDRREQRHTVISDAEYEAMKPLNDVTIENENADVKNNELPVLDSTTDADGDPIRLVPIKGEVVSVLDERFKKDKCRNPLNYTINDYINMLEMFEYLATHIDTIIKFRDKQFTIVNDYQFDIVHEMENELAKDGDTYFQDKMYVLRDYRRYMEMDYKASNIMKPFINMMKTGINPNNPLDKCIKSLKQIEQTNSQPKFIPRVDVGMAKKYDWALLRNSYNKRVVEDNSNISTEEINVLPKSTEYVDTVQPFNKTEPDEVVLKELNEMERTLRNDTSIKGNTSLTTVARLNANLKSIKSQVRLTADQVKQGFNVYRVSCKLSGGGYGVFRKWYKDYACIKSDIAIDFANQELARIKASNKGVLITDFACNKVASAE